MKKKTKKKKQKKKIKKIDHGFPLGESNNLVIG